jgi:hypothetical protein
MRDATRALDRPIVPAQAWTRLSTQLEREGLIAPASASGRRGRRGAATRGWCWPPRCSPASARCCCGASAIARRRRSERRARPSAAPGNARDPRAVEAIEIELGLAAEHYEKAIAALEGIAAEDRARIDPAVALVVERNLLLIDTAIADSRKALQGQPGSLVAQASLFDAYRQKVALLQDLIAMARK